MLVLHHWTVRNGLIAAMLLEEAGLPYRVCRGNPLMAAPTKLSATLVDHTPTLGGGPVSLSDSSAIIIYLAEKSGRFVSDAPRGRAETLQWLFRATEHIAECPYLRLDRQLAGRSFLVGADYTIADMAAYATVAADRNQRRELDDFPQVKRWFLAIDARPATVRAHALADRIGGERTLPHGRMGAQFGPMTARSLNSPSLENTP